MKQETAKEYFNKKVVESREKHIDEVLQSDLWKESLETGNYGPNSEVSKMLRDVVRTGKEEGDYRFLEWVNEQGDSFEPVVGGEKIGKKIVLVKPPEMGELVRLSKEAYEKGPEPGVIEKIKATGVLEYTYKPEQRGLPSQLKVKQMPRF
jgi:hypothetical protein